jgi:hypothetical protein
MAAQIAVQSAARHQLFDAQDYPTAKPRNTIVTDGPPRR